MTMYNRKIIMTMLLRKKKRRDEKKKSIHIYNNYRVTNPIYDINIIKLFNITITRTSYI